MQKTESGDHTKSVNDTEESSRDGNTLRATKVMILSKDDMLINHPTYENKKVFQESLTPVLHEVPFNCSPEIIELALLKFVVKLISQK